MAPYIGKPSHSQQLALAIAPKIAAILSVIGSSYIVFDVFRGKHVKKRSTYHRLMVGLSLCDILMSIGLFTSTWPMPKDTEFVYGAIGNTLSCEVVGFIEQSGVAAVIYNASLSFYYLLRIRNGVSPDRIEGCIEFWMHFIPLAFGLATMVAGLPLTLYNSGIFDCWIAKYPIDCNESWLNGGVTDCERGDNASLYQWVLDFIPKFFAIVVVTINMIIIYCAAKKRERAAHSYSFEEEIGQSSKTFKDSSKFLDRFSSKHLDNKRRPSSAINVTRPKKKLSKQLAQQSYLYVGALYLCWFPCFVTRATQLATGVTHYEMLLWISISIPLQGFFNFCVYLRPRYLKKRQEQKRRSRILSKAYSKALKTHLDSTRGGDDSSSHFHQNNNTSSSTSYDTSSNSSGGGGGNKNLIGNLCRSIVETLAEGELPEEDLESTAFNRETLPSVTTKAIPTKAAGVGDVSEEMKSPETSESGRGAREKQRGGGVNLPGLPPSNDLTASSSRPEPFLSPPPSLTAGRKIETSRRNMFAGEFGRNDIDAIQEAIESTQKSIGLQEDCEKYLLQGELEGRDMTDTSDF